MSTVTQPTITEFILARITEDEDAARRAPLVGEYTITSKGRTSPWLVAEHYNRHDPARVLAQCEAMLQIVERNGDVMGEKPPTSSLDEDGWVLLVWETMYDLAAIWSNHPDYDPAWRVK